MGSIDQKHGRVNWEKTIHTDLRKRAKANYLQPDDLIFLARTNRNFAILISDVPEKTVCNPIFFQIIIKENVPIALS
jgi:hypothetical protein